LGQTVGVGLPVAGGAQPNLTDLGVSLISKSSERLVIQLRWEVRMARFALFVDGSNLFGALKAMNLEVDDYEKLYAHVFK